MPEQVRIATRFRGPPNSGNGGYSCGVVARALDAPVAEVTLRLPPPLEVPMELRAVNGGAELYDGEALVAEGRHSPGLDLDVPEPPSLEAVETARRDSPLHEHHIYPMCFVCGPDRHEGDGLCMVCGPVEGRDIVAAPWHVDDSLPLEDGAVAAEIVWAALDCPGGLSTMLVPDFGGSVLGRLTAEVSRPVSPGRDYVAIGWPIEVDGRKFHAGSAIFTADGELVAAARATWIQIEQPLG
jgi:hypothetical protein